MPAHGLNYRTLDILCRGDRQHGMTIIEIAGHIYPLCRCRPTTLLPCLSRLLRHGHIEMRRTGHPWASDGASSDLDLFEQSNTWRYRPTLQGCVVRELWALTRPRPDRH